MKAEYVALSDAVRESIYLKNLLLSMQIEGFRLPPMLYVNNQAAIMLTETVKNQERAKHIDIKYHHVRSLVECQQLTIKYVALKENIADVLTKALPRDQHTILSIKMGMVNV